MQKCFEIRVIGKVQGVGYRYSALKKANELGLTGYVKNKVDGSVYIEAEGESHLIEQFILWCKKGPVMSRVENVVINECSLNGYHDFSVK